MDAETRDLLRRISERPPVTRWARSLDGTDLILIEACSYVSQERLRELALRGLVAKQYDEVTDPAQVFEIYALTALGRHAAGIAPERKPLRYRSEPRACACCNGPLDDPDDLLSLDRGGGYCQRCEGKVRGKRQREHASRRASAALRYHRTVRHKGTRAALARSRRDAN